MAEVLEPGAILAFGGTNARVANYEAGDILNFDHRSTPNRPDRLFKWSARQLLDAAYDGKKWMVVGVPGPVGLDNDTIGPMSNVQGFAKRQFSLYERLRQADPATVDLLDGDFDLVVVNDGTLSAHAAASTLSNERHKRVAALIFGTGIGAGVVDRDSKDPELFHADLSRPYETGHKIARIGDFTSFEQLYAGPSLEERHGYASAADIPIGHRAWQEVAGAIFKLSTDLGQDNGVDLVVVCGGVGGGGSTKYGSALKGLLDNFIIADDKDVNKVRKNLLPDIIPIKGGDYHKQFEMYGAEGVMRDYFSQAVQLQAA